MRISWQYTGNAPIKLKTFIRNQGISRHLMAKVRGDGGKKLAISFAVIGSRGRVFRSLKIMMIGN